LPAPFQPPGVREHFGTLDGSLHRSTWSGPDRVEIPFEKPKDAVGLGGIFNQLWLVVSNMTWIIFPSLIWDGMSSFPVTNDFHIFQDG
jgi:hypothetical protein